jgi:FKBP12-rapamycin complex-associated protein
MSTDTTDWLERRVTYIASLASSSIIGYILGIGDRNPQNVFLKSNGRIVHMEFRECFDTALSRVNFPEKVPFRLTRTMINAFEISRIEGTFRKCCENVLQLIRTNKDDLLGLIDVFIYDPLIPTVGMQEKSGKEIVGKIAEKLNPTQSLSVEKEVDRLIGNAITDENLAAMWRGWAPWW